MKVLLDTDIGTNVDDAVTLAYLLSQPACELVGVTTCTGQPELRAEMASAICRHAGQDTIPIHAGCPQAMLVPMVQDVAEQAAVLGDWPRQRGFASATAVPFMQQVIRQHPGEVTLLAIGPLTNVATLFVMDPEIPALLRELVLMNGCFFEGQLERNASLDPHATAIVYGTGGHARPPSMRAFGLDVTRTCAMEPDAVRERFTAAILEPVRDFAEVWFARATILRFHDPLAAACLFEPDLCRYHQGTVHVACDDPVAGQTVFTETPETPHTVACEVDSPRFFEHFFSVVT